MLFKKSVSQKSIMKVFVLFGVLFVSAMAAAMPAEVAPPPASYRQKLTWVTRITMENYNTATWTFTYPANHRITSYMYTHNAGIASVELVSGGVGYNWLTLRVVQPNFVGPLYSYRLEISGYILEAESISQELTAAKLISDGEENIFFAM
ncbi:hypothetical protein evm_013246 [Chilo suppressalis]|nr:hypothetical protein evm_013246 [Chilo suppressalis]